MIEWKISFLTKSSIPENDSNWIRRNIQFLLWLLLNYRPQRSSGKVIFSQACVILFTGEGSVSKFSGGVSKFLFQFFFFFFQFLFPQNSFWDAPPPPPRRSMRGRYAFYWNAFLLLYHSYLLRITLQPKSWFPLGNIESRTFPRCLSSFALKKFDGEGGGGTTKILLCRSTTDWWEMFQGRTIFYNQLTISSNSNETSHRSLYSDKF